MTIPAQELAALIEQSALGAVPIQAELAREEARKIRDFCGDARLDSQNSRSLRSMVRAVHDELGQHAVRRLDEVKIYGHESNYINAHPLPGKQIIVYDGLKHVIYYYTALLKVVDRLRVHRPEAQFQLADGSVQPEAIVFYAAGLSVLNGFLKTLRLPPAIDHVLAPSARGDVHAAFNGAVTFTLLHELAHIELGHLAFDQVHSERMHFAVLEPEVLTIDKENELAADEFALLLIAPDSQTAFMPSILFMFGAFAFIEAFDRNLSTSHPLAINRIARLAALCKMPADVRAIVDSWIEQQLSIHHALQADRLAGDGLITSRIESMMPVETTYGVLESIIQRVIAEHGLLEADEITA